MQFEDDIALGLNAGNEMSSCVRALAACWANVGAAPGVETRVPGYREDAVLLVLETRIIMKSTRAFMVNRLKI